MTVQSLFDLTGKRALVTGSGRGLGRAIAVALAESGAELIICARSSDDVLSVVGEIGRIGGKAEALVQDVTDIEGFARAVSAQAPIDIFVNNAGTNRPKPIGMVTVEDYDAVMDLNLKAAFFAAQAVTKRMIESGTRGSIINMSSQMGHVGAANRTLYCASKWALEGLTKALAVEVGVHGIRVNTICPTFIETPLTRPFFEDPAFKEAVLSKIKLGRLGQPSDVTGAAVFLASDASAMMTGSALMLDGGWTAD